MRMGPCVTYRQFVDEFSMQPDEANSALGLNFDTDTFISFSDTVRLGQCITHRQFTDDFKMSDSEANQALGITFGTDCTGVFGNQ